MLREIVMDTETTGLDAKAGDRLIEIGCIEIVNRIASGREFHRFIDPERDVHPDAVAIHGLATAFLKGKPLFKEVAVAFLDFIGDANLIIHNASFDIGFINAELARLQMAGIPSERVIDTLTLARRRHPAGPNSLDALCKRYGIDTSVRSKHGALVDSHLLAKVYVELLGERQATLGLAYQGSVESGGHRRARVAQVRSTPLAPRLSREDEVAHSEFVKTLGPNALWLRYQATV
jgi:DNA polymerase III subunit epsilon